jgi:UDP-N-acetylmuramate--alanine ligase
MSAIAQMLLGEGHTVRGSDRSLDQGKGGATFDLLRAGGARLFPQDGSGVSPDTDFVVVSTAIEDTVPDMRAARDAGIPVLHRSELLAEIFNRRNGIAVGGTSGKSTVTGMIAVILDHAGLSPSAINGGKIKNFVSETSLGNTLVGSSDILVIESDESDGSIVNYKPEVSLVTNITKDHKPVPELRDLFEIFIGNTNGLVVLNADCPEASTLDRCGKATVTFSLKGNGDFNAGGVELKPLSSTFRVNGIPCRLNVPGAHNVSNALAAVAACRHFDVPERVAFEALEQFKGIARRYDIVGRAGGITVIDDFGHNPDKIRATLKTLALGAQRNLLFFQSHGFGPTRFMRQELVSVFSSHMKKNDILFVPEIYYAGGTADKSLSMSDIAKDIQSSGLEVIFRDKRADLAPLIADAGAPGDIVCVMGARDDTLTHFCRDILNHLRELHPDE